jgi:hypothetical protein
LSALNTYAREDHKHGRESFGTVAAQTSFGLSSSNGAASTVARSDHAHGTVPHDVHSALTGITANDHHSQAHTDADHSDGANVKKATLTTGSLLT